ncbi:MAG TPA: hypothetical protein P5572_03555 [Phycisphaerae bacterium]|nr:hypothetical protein [Phycisphaerales bacterium]HRX84075.1 hypothetical protein [Phycisphaerae bacterium]
MNAASAARATASAPHLIDASHPAASATLRVRVPTRYLTTDGLPGLFVFPPDMAELATPINHFDNPVVTRLYRSEYHKYLD